MLADLERLESLNPKPDAAWLVFRMNGYKQGAASTEIVTAKEDRVIRSFPRSDEAYRIARERWEAAHKEPEDAKDAVAWAKYHSEYRAALKGWIQQFTDSGRVQHEEMFYAIRLDPDIPAEEGLRVVDDYLTYVAEYEQRSIEEYFGGAGFLAFTIGSPAACSLSYAIRTN